MLSRNKAVSVALFICSLTATIIFTVGFAIPAWSVRGTIARGLWQVCQGKVCFSYSEDRTSSVEGWFICVQVLECFGLICLVIAMLVAATVSLGLPPNREKLIKILVFLIFLATTFISSGLATYGMNIKDHLSHSFALVIVADILAASMAFLACAYGKRS